MEGKYVFISYKVEDSDDAVWVKETLESNGIQCWMAPDSIPGGSSYATEIENAIMNCTAFVLVLSERAQNSKWVSKEVDRAINYGKRVMPFTLDNSPLTGDFAFYLSNVQRYDATIDKLEAMRTLHADIIKEFKSPKTATVFKKKPPKDKSKKPSNKILKIVLVILVIAFALYFITDVLLAYIMTDLVDNTSDNTAQTTSAITADYFEQFQNQSDNPSQTSDNSFSIKDTGISKENVSFVLDGVAYLLPCSVGDFINNGWEVSSTSSYNMMSIIGDEAFISLCKDDKIVHLEVQNVCGDPLELIYCAVVEIEVWYNDNVDFTAPLGVRVGDTPDEITETYGTPNYVDNYEDYFEHIFMFNGEKGYIAASYKYNTYNSYVITLRNDNY